MTPEQFDTLIAHVEQGDTLKASIKAAATSYRAFALHIERDAQAATRYAHARTVSADFYADRAQEAVEQALTSEEATVGRVKADVYKWRAAMANRAVYGDKVDVSQKGELVIRVERMTPELPSATATLVEHTQPVALPALSTSTTA